MHLHGHFFQVLSKDGKPIEGSPIVKDTLNLKPGEEYEVAFVADNPVSGCSTVTTYIMLQQGW